MTKFYISKTPLDGNTSIAYIEDRLEEMNELYPSDFEECVICQDGLAFSATVEVEE